MTSHLVRKQITDKNGVNKAHWVKPDVSQVGSASLPSPSAMLTPEDKAKRIGSEIKILLSDADQTKNVNSWEVKDWYDLRIIEATGDFHSMLVIQRLVERDVPCVPYDVAAITRQLDRAGHENPSGMMNDETLQARESIVGALDTYGAAHGRPFYSEQHEAKELALMAFTDFDDAPSIIDIVSERGIIPQDEIREIIADREDISAPLRRGAL